MSGRYFLDTNILVYTFDDGDAAKRDRARGLVADALQGRGVISLQVVQEFLNVALRKFKVPMKDDEALTYLDAVLEPLCQVLPDVDLCRESLELRERWQLSWYDSLVLAAALRAGCDTLYSEDLQDGLRVRELTVVNPFAPGPARPTGPAEGFARPT